jgi:hypothetical protein
MHSCNCPLSPWCFFSQARRTMMTENNSKLNSKKRIRIIKKEWKNMGEEMKKVYKEYSKKDQDRYKLIKEPKRVTKQWSKESMYESTHAEVEDQIDSTVWKKQENDKRPKV